jgi:hypothetical protein
MEFQDTYSAEIRLELRVAGRTLRLAQIAPEFVILKEVVDLPPSEAEIVMYVDGNERRWAVFLLDGLSATSDFALTRS